MDNTIYNCKKCGAILKDVVANYQMCTFCGAIHKRTVFVAMPSDIMMLAELLKGVPYATKQE